MQARNYLSIIKVHRADIGTLILRVGVAFIFLAHGALNLTTDFESMSKVMINIGLPSASTYVISISEITSAVMLLAGILVAYAAWIGIIISAGYVILVEGQKGFETDGGGYGYPLLLLISTTAILLLGPGKFVLEKRWGREARNLREVGVSSGQHPVAT